MQNGFYPRGIRFKFLRFICFWVGDEYYTYTALPFGCSLSQLVYTKFMRTIATFMQCPRFANTNTYRHPSLPATIAGTGLWLFIHLDDQLVRLSHVR